MLNKVKLYGELAEFIGHKELEAVLNSPADAIRFLLCNFPGLEAHMADRHYKILTNSYEIHEEEIHYPVGKSNISIVPVISGAGGGLGKTLLGVAMIGLAFAVPGSIAFTKAGITGGALSKGLFGIGAALTLTGVSEMLY